MQRLGRMYKFLISLVFLFAFVVQLFFLILNYFRPTELNTVMERVDRENLEEFPLVFRTCLRPGLKMDKMKDHGYATVENYFYGIMSDNESNVGWAGTPRNLAVISPSGKVFRLLLFMISSPRYIERYQECSLSE